MKKGIKGLFSVAAGALAGAAIFKYFQNKKAAEAVVDVDAEDVSECDGNACAEDGACESECGCEEKPEAEKEEADGAAEAASEEADDAKNSEE